MQKEFEKLEKLENMEEQQRGRKFETFMTQVFKFSGYEAIKLQKPTKFGEQIDLHVFGNRNLLIECKWLKQPAELKDIESFAHRLHKRDPSTIGMFIAVNDVSRKAKELVIHIKDRILLFLLIQELKKIISGCLDLELLIEKKIQYRQRGLLYIHGETDPLDYLEYPPSYNSSFNELKFDKKIYILNEDARFHVSQPVCFSRYIPSIEENKTEILGISFHPLEKKPMKKIEIQTGLLFEILQSYYEVFGFSKEFAFAIGQNCSIWSGFGINNFINSVLLQKTRYNELQLNCHLHHRELAQAVDFWENEYYLTFGFDSDYMIANEPFNYSYFNLTLFKLHEQTNDPKIDIFAKKANLYYQTDQCAINIENLELKERPIELLIPTMHMKNDINNEDYFIGGLALNPFFDEPNRNNLSTSILDPLFKPIEYLKALRYVYVHSRLAFGKEDFNNLHTVSVSFIRFQTNTMFNPVLVSFEVNW